MQQYFLTLALALAVLGRLGHLPEKFKKGRGKYYTRISSWTAKRLSYAGRVQLVQSVLFGIQAFWGQIFVLPSKIIKMVDAHCRSYIWSGSETVTKKALVAWDKVCAPKATGGLNLTNIGLWNKAAIAKCCWDVAQKKDSLWIKWVHMYYIKGQEFQNAKVPLQACWMLRKIFESRATLLQIDHAFKSGTSIIRQIYLKLLGVRPKVEWKNLVCKNAARPKARFLMWLFLHKRLLTKDKLLAWGMTVGTQCVLCAKESETIEHLFVTCEYVKKIWAKLTQWQQIGSCSCRTWEHHQTWSGKLAKGQSVQTQVFKLVYAEVIYAVWLERNARVFKQQSSDWEKISREIACTCCMRAVGKVRDKIATLIF